MRRNVIKRLAQAALCITAIGLTPALALAGDAAGKATAKKHDVAAERDRDPLAGAPAIRHRYELRAKRFEVGPAISFSLNRSLRHAVLFGLRAEFYINDYLSIGGNVGFGVGFDTGLSNELETRVNDPAQWKAVHDRFSDVQIAGDARLVFTPFSGKMAIFGKLFVGLDFYGFAGFGFAITKNAATSSIAGDDFDAANEGFRPGLAWGVGMHMFFTKYFAVGVEIRDLLFQENEPGKDLTRGLTPTELDQKKTLVDADDREMFNHFFVGLNFTFYLPTVPDISD